jgi:general secretion pathway protein G
MSRVQTCVQAGPQGRRRRPGFSLLEAILAITVMVAVGSISIYYLRRPNQQARQAACNMCREQIQGAVERFQVSNGRMPRTDLSDLRADPRLMPSGLPVCPDDRPYLLDPRSGQVLPHTH